MDAAPPANGEEEEEEREGETEASVPEAEHCEVSSGCICLLLSYQYGPLPFCRSDAMYPLHPQSLEIHRITYHLFTSRNVDEEIGGENWHH